MIVSYNRRLIYGKRPRNMNDIDMQYINENTVHANIFVIHVDLINEVENELCFLSVDTNNSLIKSTHYNANSPLGTWDLWMERIQLSQTVNGYWFVEKFT